MTVSARRSFDALVDLIGRRPGAGEIVVQEIAGGRLGHYAGFYESDTSTAFVSEDYRQPDLVGHELAHAWFDAATFEHRWMYEGLAEWAAVETGGSTSGGCQPPPYPGFGTLDLDDWPILGPRSTEQDQQRVSHLYEAACSLFEQIADRAGLGGMRTAFGILFSGGAAYEGAEIRNGPAHPIGWRYLLDVLDERALAPAGKADLEFAEQLFLRYGVVSTEDLAGRAAARAAYHRLLGEIGTWSMPGVVPTALESWEFAGAQSMISSLRAALADVQVVDQLVPELDAVNGPVRTAVELATSPEDLARAAKLAAEQRRAAEAVVAARNALGQARDPLEELGLIGTDLAGLSDSILTAAARVDVAGAESSLASLVATLGDARQQGMTRLAIAGVPFVGFVLVGGWVVRRRRRSTYTDRGAGALPAETPVLRAEEEVRGKEAGWDSRQGSDAGSDDTRGVAS
jgi:hypothetical protein